MKYKFIGWVDEYASIFFFNKDSNAKSWSLIWSYSKMQMNNYKSSCFNFDKISNGDFLEMTDRGIYSGNYCHHHQMWKLFSFLLFLLRFWQEKNTFSKVIHHVKSWPYCEKLHIFKTWNFLDCICTHTS